MNLSRAAIAGTGHALPANVLTNSDLERLVDTTDDWIITRTGIKERHVARADEYTSTFAVAAARQALETAGVAAAELDLVICATVCPDMPLPSTACLIQAQIGAKKAAAFDIVAACSGFLYGLSIAQQFIRTGAAQKVLVIGAELLSRYVDYTDRATCVIFGDGSGAAVLTANTEGRGILATRIQSDGDYADLLSIPGGGTRNPASAESLAARLHFIKMRGNELFKIAVRNMYDVAKVVLEEAGLTADDISLLIPHQANQRIADAVAERLNVPAEKIYGNIARIGNTSSASIPIALDECVRAGRIKPGDHLLFIAFGAGVTWGATLLRW